MGISNLPGASGSFRATTGAGSFSKKLSAATRCGSLKGLQDNREGVTAAVKKYERAIRLGAFNRQKQIGAMKVVKSIEGSRLTRTDKMAVKKIFKHLAEKKAAPAPEEKKTTITTKPEKPVARTRAAQLDENASRNPYSLQPRTSIPTKGPEIQGNKMGIVGGRVSIGKMTGENSQEPIDSSSGVGGSYGDQPTALF